MAAARGRWNALAVRERWLLALAALVILALFLDQLAISPALRGIARLERELPQRRVQLARIDAMSDQFSQLAAKVAAPSAMPLRGELERAIKASGIAAELLPGGDGTAQELRVSSIQVTRLLVWIADTQRDLRVRASSLEIERTKTPEMVSARLRLERPAVDAP
jgi:general secretion pathway protein M